MAKPGNSERDFFRLKGNNFPVPFCYGIQFKKSAPGAYPQVVEIILESPFRQLQISTSQLMNQGGITTGLIRIIHDRTREVGLLKSKSEFVTVASHQLRTPLTAINWVFQELSTSRLSESERLEFVSTGTQAAAKLSKIVNDFLDITKIEEGRFGYSLAMTDVTDYVTKAVNEAAPIAKQYRVQVYFESPKEALKAPLDQQRMGIVLSNLLDNAIKYNVENGEVVVRLRSVPSRPFIELSISDTGVGITPDELKKLFTKFFRTEAGVKMDATGSGLGLYLVKNIIEQHGGTISVQSTIGRGTTFTVLLPTDPTLIPPSEVPTGE